MKCERCESETSGFNLFDYCAVCSSNLCPRCMDDGCCGSVPAKSGMEADNGEPFSEQPDLGSCSSCGGEVEFGKMAEHEKTCGVVCPECKGCNVNYDGVQIIMGGSFNSYQCDDCGKCFTKPTNG